ncbi:coiled-coil domain-containing protein 157 [Electrophorus electricus]|uniref:coiled-coil domain-containing protein 157 n=1 Tax=Electrophorus electricus TaxID=8005 RepID=UPI0015CFA059|nr:coiled-coil domain-containing protein 157 [Electrophorus electricus]
MAHLLGRQDCVDSLRRDLIDLQGAVLDVFSRTGPVRFTSWKFPDKLSCNLDLVSLLEQYDYVEGETEINQLSHIVLLELVIDRLMLLLQSFNAYVELTSGQQRAGRSGQSGPSVSLGPVVKRYWNSLVQFSNQQQQGRRSGVCSQDSSFPEDQHSTSLTHASHTHTSHTHASHPATDPIARLCNTTPGASASPLHSTAPTSTTSSVLKAGAPRPAAHRTVPAVGPTPVTYSVSCQTAESGPVPCEACARVQAGLKETAEVVAALCRSLGLPCSLQHLLVAMEDTLQLGRLSASDVALWVSEQRRDTDHLSKHMAEVRGIMESLRERLRKMEEDRDKLRLQLEREEELVKREREERRRKEEECERRLQEVKARGEEVERGLQEEQNELRREATALEKKISELTRELELKRETHQCLECERDSLMEEVHRLHLQEVTWVEVEEKSQGLEAELSSTQKLLDKECAKYLSAQHQQEAMQVKQCALLGRVDVLVQQYEDVQSRLEECEGERAELTEKLTHTTQQRDTLQEQLTKHTGQCHSLTEDRQQLQVQVRELQATVTQLTDQLQHAAQRERILVAFPELSVQQPAPQSTGDVLCDMEQQLKANTLRIRVLEQENASLNASLSKLRDVLPHCQSRGDPLGHPSVGAGPGQREPRPSNSSLSSSPLSTLRLHLSPDMAEMYNRIRPVIRSRSAAPHHRRK